MPTSVRRASWRHWARERALEIVVGLTAPHPVPGLAGSYVGGQGFGLSQQTGITVDRGPSLQTVEHGTGGTDLPREIAEAGPVQSGQIDGLYGGLEVVPHGDHPHVFP